MLASVPTASAAVDRARPKPSSMMRPSDVTNTLSGFRSRCTMPFSWAAAGAERRENLVGTETSARGEAHVGSSIIGLSTRPLGLPGATTRSGPDARRRHAPLTPKAVREVAVIAKSQIQRQGRQVVLTAAKPIRRKRRAEPPDVASQCQSRRRTKDPRQMER